MELTSWCRQCPSTERNLHGQKKAYWIIVDHPRHFSHGLMVVWSYAFVKKNMQVHKFIVNMVKLFYKLVGENRVTKRYQLLQPMFFLIWNQFNDNSKVTISAAEKNITAYITAKHDSFTECNLTLRGKPTKWKCCRKSPFDQGSSLKESITFY